MSYEETLDYLYTKLPMFSRIGNLAIKKDLDNTFSLCEFLGNPHHKIKTIHIAGTNGKGSVAHILASVLQEAGYKTGLYTSPHLKDFRERIKINGKPCKEKFVIQFTDKIKPKIEEIEPSFFEITVAMAFTYFAKKKVDIAIIETGLGGRLDSTNIIHPILSIITNIGFDHQQLLGNTLQEIAAEKAGIIKKETPVVIGKKQLETSSIFIEQATKKNAPIIFSDDVVSDVKTAITSNYLMMDAMISNQSYNVCCDINSIYQTENIKTVLTSIHVLNETKKLEIKSKAIQLGFYKVKKNTQFQGRWQTILNSPRVIVDVGHNEDGIIKINEQLNQEKYKQLHIIFGMVKDKDVDTILSVLPKNANYYFTEPPIPRKLESSILKEKASKYQLNGDAFSSPVVALEFAKTKANTDDLILVCGSFFVIAEVL